MCQGQGCMGYENSQLGCAGPWVNLICNIFAVAFLITGLMTNILNVFTVEGNILLDVEGVGTTNEIDAYCGWNSIWMEDNFELIATHYEYYCNNPEDVPEGELQNDFCETRSCGQAYIVLAIAAGMLGISAILSGLVSMFKYDDGYGDTGCGVCKKMLELFCVVLCVSAIVGWFFNNDICWGEDKQEQGIVSIGPTIWWLSGSTGTFLIACIIRFI